MFLQLELHSFQKTLQIFQRVQGLSFILLTYSAKFESERRTFPNKFLSTLRKDTAVSSESNFPSIKRHSDPLSPHVYDMLSFFFCNKSLAVRYNNAGLQVLLDVFN